MPETVKQPETAVQIGPLTGRICRRNGEQPCFIEFHGVRVELGITELRALLKCALMDLRNASGPTRLTLDKPVRLLSELCDVATALGPAPNAVDMETNRQRWQDTGIGGETDTSALEQRLAYWRGRLRGNSTEEFRAIQREANGRL